MASCRGAVRNLTSPSRASAEPVAKKYVSTPASRSFGSGQSLLRGANLHAERHGQQKEDLTVTFENGELVGVPCSIQLGPFPQERLVEVDTEDGTIWGFVQQDNLKMSSESGDSHRGYVKGAVVEQASGSILVRMFGSFFTTALGLASVKPNGLMRLAAQ
jgi:hypothetical protein